VHLAARETPSSDLFPHRRGPFIRNAERSATSGFSPLWLAFAGQALDERWKAAE
jgi:hypothetical protein